MNKRKLRTTLLSVDLEVVLSWLADKAWMIQVYLLSFCTPTPDLWLLFVLLEDLCMNLKEKCITCYTQSAFVSCGIMGDGVSIAHSRFSPSSPGFESGQLRKTFRDGGKRTVFKTKTNYLVWFGCSRFRSRPFNPYIFISKLINTCLTKSSWV